MHTDFRGLDPKGLPVVSVVAVCYNHEKYLEETLDSIKEQTYPNIQLIIMDDCSQDGSVGIIEDWIKKNKANCQFIPHTENLGLCKTLNEALEYSIGEYYQLIACDDIILPEKIENQVKTLIKSSEDVMVLHSNSIAIDENGDEISNYGSKFDQEEITTFENLLHGCEINAPTALIKKEVLSKIGKYDESLQFEDWDFWLRVAKDYTIIFSLDKTIKYRVLQDSLSRRFGSIEYYQSVYLMLSKHISKKNSNNITNLIRDQYLSLIKGIYLINNRLDWYIVIIKNKFSFMATYHFVMSSLGFTYHQGTKILKVFGIK